MIEVTLDLLEHRLVGRKLPLMRWGGQEKPRVQRWETEGREEELGQQKNEDLEEVRGVPLGVAVTRSDC